MPFCIIVNMAGELDLFFLLLEGNPATNLFKILTRSSSFLMQNYQLPPIPNQSYSISYLLFHNQITYRNL